MPWTESIIILLFMRSSIRTKVFFLFLTILEFCMFNSPDHTCSSVPVNVGILRHVAIRRVK